MGTAVVIERVRKGQMIHENRTHDWRKALFFIQDRE